jgi:8-oxo-dGTP pyrophosphatase MutT (NUDIX family)
MLVKMTSVGAGCLFIQNSFALAAYTPKLKKWSGIGGLINPNESLRYTAIREMLEELFGLEPSEEIIMDCEYVLRMVKLVVRDNYGILIISFDDYILIAKVLVGNKIVSPYYKTIPMNFVDLITERLPQESAEITDLRVINYNLPNPDVTKELLDDCYFVEKNLKS